MVNLLEIAIEFAINKSLELGIDAAKNLSFNSELHSKLHKYAEIYFQNTYEHLSLNQEFDFFKLNEFLFEKIDKDLLLRFGSYPYHQRKETTKRFIENAYDRACANTVEKKKIVDTYVITILEIVENLILYENKLPEITLVNRSVDEIAYLIENLNETFKNDTAYLNSKDTFANYINLLNPPAQSKNPFHYLNEDMGFYGREKEIAALTQFLNDKRQVLCAAIVGSGGIGKSKLMKEFIDLNKHNQNWKMIQCNHLTTKRLFDFKTYYYERGLLIVIDYASILSVEIGNWIYSLSILSPEALPKKLRIILLDRDVFFSENFEDSNWLMSIMGIPSEARYECLNKIFYKWPSTKNPILKLESLDWGNMLNIVKDYANIIKKTLSLQDQEQIINISQRLANQNKLSPLFVLLVADAHLREGNLAMWNIETIMGFIINRYKKYWINLCHNNVKLMKSLSELLIFSTICGQFNILEDQLPKTFHKARRYLETETNYSELKSLICAVNENDNFDGFLHPIEPDIIGQAFVLQFMYEHWHDKEYIIFLIKQLNNTKEVIRFFAKCSIDFNTISPYSEILEDRSYIWAVLNQKACNLNFAKSMLAEDQWDKKMELMCIFKNSFNLYFDNFVIFRTLIVKLFLDRINGEQSTFFYSKLRQYPQFAVDNNIIITASLLMDCKRRSRCNKDADTYLSEGAQYLLQKGFSKNFCEICKKANLQIKCEKPIESQLLEIISAFSEMLIHGFYPETYEVPMALYLLNDKFISGNFYKDYSVIQLFNEFVIYMENIYLDSDEDEVDLAARKKKLEQEILKLNCSTKKKKYNQLLALSLVQGKEDKARYYCQRLWNQ